MRKKDQIAYFFMRKLDAEARHIKAVLGGQRSSAQRKKHQTYFWDSEWQKRFGDRGAGKRNVRSGFLAKFNDQITKEQPYLRSQAGKVGGQRCSQKQKLEKTACFHPNSQVQKKGNLVRWGIVIKGVRIAFQKLSSTFVDYHFKHATQKSY